MEEPTIGAELCRLQLEFEHLKAKYKRLRKGLAMQAQFHAIGAGPAPKESALNQLDDLRGELEETLARMKDLESQRKGEDNARKRLAKRVLSRLKSR